MRYIKKILKKIGSDAYDPYFQGVIVGVVVNIGICLHIRVNNIEQNLKNQMGPIKDRF